MPRKRINPLLAALIAEIPASGSDWPEDRQLSWLKLTAIAFGTIYGGNVAGQLTFGNEPASVASKPQLPTWGNGKIKPKEKVHAFYIDPAGYARRADGSQIMPDDLGGTSIYDTRGMDGEIHDIIWADGSRGLMNGQQISIDAE